MNQTYIGFHEFNQLGDSPFSYMQGNATIPLSYDQNTLSLSLTANIGYQGDAAFSFDVFNESSLILSSDCRVEGNLKNVNATPYFNTSALDPQLRLTTSDNITGYNTTELVTCLETAEAKPLCALGGTNNFIATEIMWDMPQVAAQQDYHSGVIGLASAFFEGMDTDSVFIELPWLQGNQDQPI